MSRLSHHDYALLLECLGELHSLPDLPSLRLWLVDKGLPRLIVADWYSYNEVDLHGPGLTVLMRPDDEAALRLAPAWVAHVHEHPLVMQTQLTGDLRAMTISEFLPRAAYRRLGLYGEVYRHLRVEYQISAAMTAAEGHVTAVAISRQRRDFSARDRAVLEHLRGHLRIAFRNLLAARATGQELDAATSTLETLNAAGLVVDSRGRILRDCTAAAPRLGAYFGELVDGRVPGRLQSWIRSQLEAGDGLAARRGPLVQDGEKGSLTLHLAPGARAHEWLLVMQEQPALDWEAALQPLGLTRREREIARWIAEGKSNREIGGILGISPRTVQKHLEHLFATLGVEKRTAAMAVLLGLSRGGAG